MTTLRKTIKTSYIPGSPGVPGSPGQPGLPARWVNEVTQVCAWRSENIYRINALGQTEINFPPFGWVPIWQAAQLGWLGSTAPIRYVCEEVVVARLLPGQPYIAPTPAVPATPAQIIQDLQLGWNGKARLVAELEGVGGFTFGLPIGSSGVAIGVTEANVAMTDTGYAKIRHGFFYAAGILRTVTDGNLSEWTQVIDRWSSGVTDGVLSLTINKVYDLGDWKYELLIGGDVQETDLLLPDAGVPLALEVALYTGGDAVVDASLVMMGGGAGTFMALDAQGGAGTYRGGVAYGRMVQLASLAAGYPTGGGEAIFAFLVSAGSEGARAEGIGTFESLSAYAEGYLAPPTPVGGYGFMFPLDAICSGLTGETGGSHGIMPVVSNGPASDHPYGEAIGALQAPTGLATNFSNENEALVFSQMTMAGSYTSEALLFVTFNSTAQVAGLFSVERLVDAAAMSEAEASDTMSSNALIDAILMAFAQATNLADGPSNSVVWALNTKTSASTRYENYEFNSYARIGGKYFGMKDDGLYELSGADDNGAHVQARVNLGRSNFGTSRLKSLTQAYVGVASDQKVLVKVVADGQEYIFAARDASTDLATQRVDFARGFRANYFELEIMNQLGGAFDLSTVEFTPIPLSRRI